MDDPILRLRQTLTLLFLGLVLLLAVLWGSRPLQHDDLFFHLATGRYVVGHLQVPTVDLFSFTRSGEPWVSHEWGFGVLAYFFWFASGYGALVVLKASAVVTILLLLMALMCRSSGSSLASPGSVLVALLALGLWAISDQLILRASLFSSLFLLLLLHLLYWFDRTGSRISAAAIGGLFLLWGNFHSEVVFGLFLLGTVAVESLLGRWKDSTDRLPTTLLKAAPDRPYLPLFGVSLLLTLVNPNGWQVLLYPFRLAWFLFVRGDTLEMGHFTGATPAATPAFYLLIVLLLLGLLPLERLRVLSFTQLATVGVFLLLSIRSHRFLLFFTIFALPVIARLLSQQEGWSPAWIRSRMVRGAAVGLGMVAVAAATATAWGGQTRAPISRHFPAGAVRFLAEEDVAGRLFNHQNYGGYLHWNLGEPIFWDGRNLLFASLMEEVRERPLKAVTNDWHLEYLVLADFEYRRLEDQLDPSDWGLVYWDDYAAIYLRRAGRNRFLLDRAELLQLPPFGGVEGLNIRVQDPARATATRLELDRVLRFTPDCQRALYFHGLISLYEGDLERAERELRLALEPGPNSHVLEALGRVLDGLGRQEEALQMRREAIAVTSD